MKALAWSSLVLLVACAAPETVPSRAPAPPPTDEADRAAALPPGVDAPMPSTSAPADPHADDAPSAPSPTRAASLRDVANQTRTDLRKAGFTQLEDSFKPTGQLPAHKVHEGFYATGPHGPEDPAVASSQAFVTRVLEALFHERFDKAPEPPVLLVLLPEAKSYERFCKAAWDTPCLSPYGFYVPAERRLVVNLGPGIGTLSHELVHPIVEADFPAAPTWLNEGIASLFEAPIMPKKGEIHGAKNWRYPALKAALGSDDGKKKVGLPALFGLSDEQFRTEADEKRNYAAARYFCQWMDGRGLLFPFYRAYRDGHAGDPTGEKAFKRVTGESVAEANAAWLRWAGSL